MPSKPTGNNDVVFSGRTSSEVKLPSFGESVLFALIVVVAAIITIGPAWLILIEIASRRRR
jgi:hypothetical protein